MLCDFVTHYSRPACRHQSTWCRLQPSASGTARLIASVKIDRFLTSALSRAFQTKRHQYQMMNGDERATGGADAVQLSGGTSQARGEQGEAETDSRGPVECAMPLPRSPDPEDEAGTIS
jgi:hypothetical protein